MNKQVQVLRTNLKLFGVKYVSIDFIYQALKRINTLRKTKDVPTMNKESLVIKEVNDYKMFLDKFGKGIERDLLIDGIREPLSTQIMKEWIKEGDTILDLGANIGYYTIMMSKLVGERGKIYAVEPAKRNFWLLEKNSDLNNLNNVELYKLAFGDGDGEINLYIYEGGNYNTPIKLENAVGVEKVKMTTIDEFFKNRKKPDLVRMDVEGYEYQILHGGAEKTLNHIDKIFVELHFGLVKKKDMIALLTLLKKKGFEIKCALLEWKRNEPENKVSGRLLNYLYKKRSGPRIYENLKIDDILNAKEILNGHLSYEVFLEKKKV